jgi:hypothetical protein
MMIDVPTYQGLPNVAPWQFAGAGFGGSLPGQNGPGFGGQGVLQPNGAPTQLGLSPLAAACLAAQAAFVSVLGQYAPLAGAGGAGQPLAGQLGLGPLPSFSPFGGFGTSLAAYGQPYGQPYGQQPFGPQGIGGWPAHQQQLGWSPLAAPGLVPQGPFGGGINPALAALSAGAFGQRGPWSGIGSHLPFAMTPQMAYAG